MLEFKASTLRLNLENEKIKINGGNGNYMMLYA
jgi:hypothetical protein